jgi:regulator of replication initiation timing
MSKDKDQFSFNKEFACQVGFRRLKDFEGYLEEYSESGDKIKAKYTDAMCEVGAFTLACLKQDNVRPSQYTAKEKEKEKVQVQTIQEMMQEKLQKIMKETPVSPVLINPILISETESDSEQTQVQPEQKTIRIVPPLLKRRLSPQECQDCKKKDSELNQLKRDAAIKEKHLTEQGKLLTELQRTILNHQETIEDKNKRLAAYEKQTAQLNERLETLQKKLALHIEKNHQLTVENYAAKDRITQLTSQLSIYAPFKSIIDQVDQFSRKRQRPE